MLWQPDRHLIDRVQCLLKYMLQKTPEDWCKYICLYENQQSSFPFSDLIILDVKKVYISGSEMPIIQSKREYTTHFSKKGLSVSYIQFIWQHKRWQKSRPWRGKSFWNSPCGMCQTKKALQTSLIQSLNKTIYLSKLS